MKTEEELLSLCETTNGTELIRHLITVLESPHILVVRNFLKIENVVKLKATEHRLYVNTLEMFCMMSFRSYIESTEALCVLNCRMEHKLKLITLLSLGNRSPYIPLNLLMKELMFQSESGLENFIMSVNKDLIECDLDKANNMYVVKSCKNIWNVESDRLQTEQPPGPDRRRQLAASQRPAISNEAEGTCAGLTGTTFAKNVTSFVKMVWFFVRRYKPES